MYVMTCNVFSLSLCTARSTTKCTYMAHDLHSTMNFACCRVCDWQKKMQSQMGPLISLHFHGASSVNPGLMSDEPCVFNKKQIYHWNRTHAGKAARLHPGVPWAANVHPCPHCGPGSANIPEDDAWEVIFVRASWWELSIKPVSLRLCGVPSLGGWKQVKNSGKPHTVMRKTNMFVDEMSVRIPLHPGYTHIES